MSHCSLIEYKLKLLITNLYTFSFLNHEWGCQILPHEIENKLYIFWIPCTSDDCIFSGYPVHQTPRASRGEMRDVPTVEALDLRLIGPIFPHLEIQRSTGDDAFGLVAKIVHWIYINIHHWNLRDRALKLITVNYIGTAYFVYSYKILTKESNEKLSPN